MSCLISTRDFEKLLYYAFFCQFLNFIAFVYNAKRFAFACVSMRFCVTEKALRSLLWVFFF